MWSNWARTHSCTPQETFTPTTVEALRGILIRAVEVNASVKAVGAGHSPNASCCTDSNGWMVRMHRLDAVISIDALHKTVKAQAGITLAALTKALAAKTLQLSFLPSIAEQTLGGAIATATHATGVGYPSLSGVVVGLELMTAQGDVIACSPTHNASLFDAARCSLGVLGIVVTVTVSVERMTLFCLRTAPAPDEVVRRTYANKVAEHQHYKFVWVPHRTRARKVFAIVPRKSQPLPPPARPIFSTTLCSRSCSSSGCSVRE